MQNLNIICIDDQREVLASLKKDLETLKSYFDIEYCESAEEAKELIEEIDKDGNEIAVLICDHIMPESTGVDFLVEIDKDIRFSHTKKILFTGLATHKDAIMAINNADLDYYIEKPWESENLIAAVKTLITKFILERGINYSDYLPVLDQEVLYQELRNRT